MGIAVLHIPGFIVILFVMIPDYPVITQPVAAQTPRRQRPRILFAVLNWGLGHAAESLPIIQALRAENDIFLVACGRAAIFLKSELPGLPVIEIPDFTIQYIPRRLLLVPGLILQAPRMIYSLWREHRWISAWVTTFQIDLIISDNRYGVFCRRIPSLFITHQLRFKLPGMLRHFEIISEWFNRFCFRFFSAVLVLDEAGKPNLAGELTHRGRITRHPKVHYIGLWSSVQRRVLNEDIDILAVISGTEPHRQLFADAIIRQLREIPGRKIIVLGVPEETAQPWRDGDTEIYPFMGRAELNELLNRSKIIICRSGYASSMDLVAVQKPALLVPTPGQSEQEYQARYYYQNGYFYFTEQSRLHLAHDLPIARSVNGISTSGLSVNNMTLLHSLIRQFLPQRPNE